MITGALPEVVCLGVDLEAAVALELVAAWKLGVFTFDEDALALL